MQTPSMVQVAKQQGEYVAKLLASGKAEPGKPIQGAKPFRSGLCVSCDPEPCCAIAFCLPIYKSFACLGCASDAESLQVEPNRKISAPES